MYCKKCGNKVAEGALFCQKCGTNLSKDNLGQQESGSSSIKKIGWQVCATLSNMPKEKKNKLIPIVIGVIILFVFVVGKICMGNSSKEDIVNRDSISVASKPITVSEAEQIFEEWLVEHPLGQSSSLQLLAEYGVTEDGNECYVFSLWVDGEEQEVLLFNKIKGNFIVSGDKECSIDDWYENVWLAYGDYNNDVYYYEDEEYESTFMLDDALCGRWRSDDGQIIELSADGFAQTNLGIEPFWAPGSITSIMWDTSSGQLSLIAYYDAQYKYTYTEKNMDDEWSYDKIIFRGVQYGGSLEFNRLNDTEGDNIIGEWVDGQEWNGPDTIPYYIFNEDGTGTLARGSVECTWQVDDEYFYMNYALITSYDYYVQGDMLQIFFADGSKYYTRVGN